MFYIVSNYLKLYRHYIDFKFRYQRTTFCSSFEINFTNTCLAALVSSKQTLFHRPDGLPNNGYFIEIQPPLHACFKVHEPSRQARGPRCSTEKGTSASFLPERDTIHKSTSRECVSVSEQRGLFAAGPRLFITFASVHPSLGIPSPLMQPSIRLHCRESVAKASPLLQRRCTTPHIRAPAGKETKKRREEELRPNPLHSRGAVAEAGI